jgi:hypothetical protein
MLDADNCAPSGETPAADPRRKRHKPISFLTGALFNVTPFSLLQPLTLLVMAHFRTMSSAKGSVPKLNR